jgi:hypothetical protein
VPGSAIYRAEKEREEFARLRAESPDLGGSLTRDPGWRDRDGRDPDAHFRTVSDGVFRHPAGTNP